MTMFWLAKFGFKLKRVLFLLAIFSVDFGIEDLLLLHHVPIECNLSNHFRSEFQILGFHFKPVSLFWNLDGS